MKNNNFCIELEKGEYFDYGERYFVTFRYGSSDEQRKMYDLFENGLLSNYGANSRRALDGKDYIMPYFVDQDGNFSANNTGIIGGTSIPDDLLDEFIRRFVEVDHATVKCGKHELSGEFDYNLFDDIKKGMGLNIELKKGNYFDYGERYSVEFNYGSVEDQRRMYDLFGNILLNNYGANSKRASEGKDYIMPYFVDQDGNFSANNTGIIGGTSIPDDLLNEFIRRFVEVDHATVKCGDQEMSGKFDDNKLNDMLQMKNPTLH